MTNTSDWILSTIVFLHPQGHLGTHLLIRLSVPDMTDISGKTGKILFRQSDIVLGLFGWFS